MISMTKAERDIQRKLRILRHFKETVHVGRTLEQKLAHWERFYNLSRPYGAFNGKAPYEGLREKL
jgi:hypothetical protein